MSPRSNTIPDWRRWGPGLTSALLLSLVCTCAPAKKVRLPVELKEASGLVIDGDDYYWHNDSGDGPYVYVSDARGNLRRIDTLAAEAVDYEDLTRDPAGNFYVGDFGNNRGNRKNLRIYRYDPNDLKTDTINFHYPGQSGRGRGERNEWNCEALVYHGNYLHLFTKAGIGRKSSYYTYHYRVPARPGDHTAELLDSLYLPNRVVTAAALDSSGRTLYLTAYTFHRALGFLPNGAASLFTIRDYPEDRFLRGTLHRRRLSWGIPTQYEAVDFAGDYVYVASEATVARRWGVVRRLRRGGRQRSPGKE